MTASESYDIHEAKTQLSRIIERVERGERVIIKRAGVPVAEVIPFPRKAGRRQGGTLAGKIDLTTDWDSAATSDQIAAEFESR